MQSWCNLNFVSITLSFNLPFEGVKWVCEGEKGNDQSHVAIRRLISRLKSQRTQEPKKGWSSQYGVYFTKSTDRDWLCWWIQTTVGTLALGLELNTLQSACSWLINKSMIRKIVHFMVGRLSLLLVSRCPIYKCGPFLVSRLGEERDRMCKLVVTGTLFPSSSLSSRRVQTEHEQMCESTIILSPNNRTQLHDLLRQNDDLLCILNVSKLTE